MKNNIFIVRTPLQSFNAVEAKERFCRDENNHIVIVCRSNRDRELFAKIILQKEWSKIQYVNIKPHLQLLTFFRKLLKDTPKVEKCFLGDYSTIISYYMNRVKYQKLILLEDGASTIRRAELLEERVWHKLKKTAYSKKSKIEIFLEKLLKIDISYYYNGIFFTIYNLNNQIDMIKNDYRFFKDRLKSRPKKEVAFFIGSSIINTRILLDVETFEKYVTKVSEIYKQRGMKFYYILHRKEDEEYMKQLSERLDFKCLRFDNIIELEFVEMEYIPYEISTFMSSAVTTLHSLYPSTYKYCPFELDDITPKFKDPMEKLYIQYDKEGIGRL